MWSQRRHPQLFEIIGALQAAGSLSRGLNGGQQEGDQNADDRDDNQQFDQGETFCEFPSHNWASFVNRVIHDIENDPRIIMPELR